MTKAIIVFDNAMAMMDEFTTELGEDGRYHPSEEDTLEYKARTPAILNILMGELYPYSDTYKLGDDGKRPIVKPLAKLENNIDLDDYICRTVMPYGLAAHLLLQEDPTAANFFQQRYDELKARLQIGMPAVSTNIVDVYAGGYYDENGIWHYYDGDPLGFSRGGRWG